MTLSASFVFAPSPSDNRSGDNRVRLPSIDDFGFLLSFVAFVAVRKLSEDIFCREFLFYSACRTT